MLTTVGRYFDPWEAHVLRARLESEGIPATVAGDQHIIANWPLSVALGGAALQVPAAYLAQAQKIVADYHAGSLEADLLAEHPDAADACPTCGSGEVVGSVPLGQRALTIATFLLASAPFPARASRMHCQACGHAWRYGG
ncbi:putative signal transducing protein [Arenimonas alkanexedens]